MNTASEEWTTRLAIVVAGAVVLAAIAAVKSCTDAESNRQRECDRNGGVMVCNACMRVKEQPQ